LNPTSVMPEDAEDVEDVGLSDGLTTVVSTA
jgi:hypothetical protein